VSSLGVTAVGDAAVLTIDRPKTRNAIDRRLARRLGEAIRIASRDPRVRGVVLTAAGDETFVSGGDLNEIDELRKGGSGGREVLGMIEDLIACETCEVPVIAAVQGHVLGGGCELLLLCDLVIAEEHATFSFKHAKMGLSPAWGGLTRLVERSGPLEAARLLFTAERIDAAEALRIGLVNEVVPKGTARSRGIARVGRIADNPRGSVAALKRALREVRQARRADALDRERGVFSERWDGPDHRDAMDAFAARKG
jgi:enoyl-CoA hydratase/carnithine racemase